MSNSIPKAALAEFDRAIGLAKTPDEAFGALHALAEAAVGVKLFTVMTVDMAEGVARRAYTSDPEAYPATGTKPIHRDEWFDIVHRDRRPFVANTIEGNREGLPGSRTHRLARLSIRSSICRSACAVNSSRP